MLANVMRHSRVAFAPRIGTPNTCSASERDAAATSPVGNSYSDVARLHIRVTDALGKAAANPGQFRSKRHTQLQASAGRFLPSD